MIQAAGHVRMLGVEDGKAFGVLHRISQVEIVHHVLCRLHSVQVVLALDCECEVEVFIHKVVIKDSCEVALLADQGNFSTRLWLSFLRLLSL